MELIATVRALLQLRRAEDARRFGAAMAKHLRRSQRRGDASGLLGPGFAGQSHAGAHSGANVDQVVGKELPELWNLSVPPEGSLFTRMLSTRARVAEDRSLGDGWLQVSVDPIRDGEGEIKGVLCLVVDITDRKRMEMQLTHQAEELRKAGQRKDEFLAMLAHELAIRWRHWPIRSRSFGCSSRGTRWWKSRLTSRGGRSGT